MNLADPTDDRQAFSRHPKVVQIYRTLTIVWFAMIFSMGMMSFVLLKAIKTGADTHSGSIGLQVLGALFAFGSFYLPGIIARKIKSPPTVTDPYEAMLPGLMIEYVLRFAMTESSLMLLLIAERHATSSSAFVYFGAALAVMIFHFPRLNR